MILSPPLGEKPVVSTSIATILSSILTSPSSLYVTTLMLSCFAISYAGIIVCLIIA